MLTVAALHVYPVKGAAGFAPERWPLDERGLRYDRRFMVVTPEGRFITQRDVPALALVRATIRGESVRVTCGDAVVEAPLAPTNIEVSRVTVWESAVVAGFPSRDADDALSGFLARPCRLAWMPDDAARLTDADRGSPQRLVSFADAVPALAVTEAALAGLNSRLIEAGASAIPLDRFRPNIVIAGADEGDDDTWGEIDIGAARCRVTAACKRCQVVTVDQATGMKTSSEPLRTLATYRREGDAVTFGQHLIVDRTGEIAIGDRVSIVARRGR